MKEQTKTSEKIFASLTGILFLSVLLYIAITPTIKISSPFIIQVILSLSAAAFGAAIPGLLEVESKVALLSIRASGAIGLFVIVFTADPKDIYRPPPSACAPGESRQGCPCENGKAGYQYCSSEGVWERNCLCERDCTPGTQRPCTCADQTGGFQYCSEKGTWPPSCTCQEPKHGKDNPLVHTSDTDIQARPVPTIESDKTKPEAHSNEIDMIESFDAKNCSGLLDPGEIPDSPFNGKLYQKGKVIEVVFKTGQARAKEGGLEVKLFSSEERAQRVLTRKSGLSEAT